MNFSLPKLEQYADFCNRQFYNADMIESVLCSRKKEYLGKKNICVAKMYYYYACLHIQNG